MSKHQLSRFETRGGWYNGGVGFTPTLGQTRTGPTCPMQPNSHVERPKLLVFKLQISRSAVCLGLDRETVWRRLKRWWNRFSRVVIGLKGSWADVRVLERDNSTTWSKCSSWLHIVTRLTVDTCDTVDG